MNKTLKGVLIILLITVLALFVIGFGIILCVSWVFGGVRFTPDAAVEAASLTSSERPCIKADGVCFYYETAEGREDWICDVMIAEQNNIGLWHPVTDPRNNYPIYIEDTGEWAGTLMYVKKNGVYHNFYIPPVSGYDESTVPDFVKEGYTHITVGGEMIEPFKHSYFTTEYAVEEIEINGVKAVLEK